MFAPHVRREREGGAYPRAGNALTLMMALSGFANGAAPVVRDPDLHSILPLCEEYEE